MILGIYSRVSTEEQAEKGISLDNQVHRGTQLAIRMSWEPKVYQDAGVSGTLPVNKRPGLKAMMEDIASRKIGAVWVSAEDRLSRAGIIETTAIKDIFRENKIRYFENEVEINLHDINVGLLSDIKTLLAQFESAKTGARISADLKANIEKGKVSGGPLITFGYTKDENKMLVIDEDERAVVEYIFKLALEGKGTKVIAGILNDEGILTKRGRVDVGKGMMVKGKKKETFLWRDSVIYRILTNSIYTGQRLYKDKHYPFPNLAIISESTLSLVKDKLSNRNQFKDTTNKYNYQLKGLIQCGTCRGRFYGHKRANGKDNTYICNSQRYGEWCGNKGINIDSLDQLVIDNILKLEDTTAKAFVTMATKSTQGQHLKDFNRYTEKIKEVDTRISNLIMMAETAAIDPAMFKTRIEELNKSKTNYNNLLEQVRKTLGVFEHEKAIKQFIKETVADFKILKTDEARKLAIQNIVDCITLRWNEEESQHMIGIFFRLDKIARYTDSNNEVYFMNNEITLTRKPDNRIGSVVDERLYLSNAINYSDEEIQLLRSTIPYPEKSLTTAQGHSMVPVPLKIDIKDLKKALVSMKDEERIRNTNN
ncbi:recombinase family protein [Mucilaginibacter sp.]|uniref:recombinase family protein n=1 Tax=Mucilaginibacter sp. TaxID=1882438 RepID=UPI0025DA3EA2|nr:recombinase family protein [Mucilaginibacter sp.]